MYSNRWRASISVFAVGVAAGAALGLLFAPRSGEETREFIADTAREGLDGVVAQGQKLTRRAQRAANQARGQVEAATDAGARAFDQAAGHV